MNPRLLAFAAITLLGAPSSGAQNTDQHLQQDPLREAISKSIGPAADKPNEITVRLDPVGPPPPPSDNEAQPEPAPPAGEPAPPAGEPAPPAGEPAPPAGEPAPPAGEPAPAPAPPPADPAHGKDAAKPPADAPPADAPPADAPPAEPVPPSRQGLAVRVEKLQVGTDNIDPSQVKLLAPFPAKPLAPAPAGWHLSSSPAAPPFSREVELSPGHQITLTIHPHLLVPDADGSAVFNVSEPGFDAQLGYRQNATIGAILAHSIRQLEDDSKKLGATIDTLQQILISLPKPQPEPPADPTSVPKPAPAHLR